MKSIAYRIKGITWYQWAFAVCLFLYLIYLSITWIYLPGKIKDMTEIGVSKLIGREISMEKVSFNPFNLSLSTKNFSVSDKSGKPFIAWNQLEINFSIIKSVFSWGIALDEINLDNPKINIVKDKEGFNFDDIIKRLSTEKDTSQKKKSPGGSISLEISNTSINRGKFTYNDKSGNAQAGIDLDDISLTVEELYFATGDEHLNPFNLKASGPKGSQIQLEGNYRVHPLHIEGNIKIGGVNLSNFSGFLENILPIRLSKGNLSLSTDVLAKNDTEFTLKTFNGNLSIDNLLLDDNVQEPSMLTAGRIDVQDCGLDLTGQKLMVEKILLDNITLNQWIDETGRLRYEALLTEKKPEDITEKEIPVGNRKSEAMPWDIMVKQISLKNSSVNFDDRNANITRGHSLSDINLDLRDISLANGSKIPVKLAAMLDEKGAIGVDGSICLSPLAMELDYHLDKILLNPFSEYLEAASWLSVEDGSLSVEGKMSATTGEATSVNTTASMGVDDFKLNDTRSGEPVIGLKEIRLDNIRAEMDKHKVSIASISFFKPDLNLSVSEEKKLNLASLIKEIETEKKPESPSVKTDQTRPWRFEIEKVNLSEGTLLFSDQSVKPAYKTGLYNMAFSMDQFGSDINRPAPFTFKTEIDKYAPFTITGSLDPINKQPGFAFKSALKGLDMSHLSPYSGVYIGNNLKSGKLSLNLDYTLHDRKLKGKNNINAKNLYLGEKVPVEPVINAPVGLGLVLLRDMSGVIDLNLGVSGDLDDPGFSVSGVIVKALVNIITKAAASPFKLLGALIPGGGDNLGNVTFDPGNSNLTQESRDSLKKLVDALNKKPKLILFIKGNASGQEDNKGLTMAHLKQRTAEKRGVALSVIEEEIKEQDLWMIAKNHAALEAINNEMGLTAVSERMENSKATSPENTRPPGTAEDQNAITAEQTVFKQVYSDILASWKIEEDELISLADERALSIKKYLVDDLKLNHERVSVIKAHSSDLSGRVIKLEVDVR